MSVSNHVEVATNKPRCARRRRDGTKLIQKSRPELRDRRSVNVGEHEGEVRKGRCQRDRVGVRRIQGVRDSEEGVGPSCQDATGGAVRRGEKEGIEATREEGGQFVSRDRGKFCFLKQNNVRVGRKKLHEDIRTFFIITKPSYIPRIDSKGSIHWAHWYTPSSAKNWTFLHYSTGTSPGFRYPDRGHCKVCYLDYQQQQTEAN
jgi:hypothetical protein